MNLASNISEFTKEQNFLRTHSITFGYERPPIFEMGSPDPRLFRTGSLARQYFTVSSKIDGISACYGALHFEKWSRDFNVFQSFTYKEFKSFVSQYFFTRGSVPFDVFK